MSGRFLASPCLLVDVGNTRIKWAPWDTDRLGPISALIRNRGLFNALSSEWEKLPVPAEVRVSNVAGERIGAIVTKTSRALWGIRPRFAVTGARAAGVTNGYSDPSRLGIDRWLALIAAFRLQRAAVVVVDAGTAITLDVVDGDGNHLGGMILPGLHLMREALLQHTQIPTVEAFSGDERLLGHDSATCIRAGAIQAAVGMIERVRRRLREARGLDPVLFLTGSDAMILASGLSGHYRLEPGLVLHGLVLLQDW